MSNLLSGRNIHHSSGGVFTLIVLFTIVILITLLKNDLQDLPNIPTRLSMMTLRVNEFPLRVRVAQTEAEKMAGLNSLRSMPFNEGVLFVFNDDGVYGVSTKNMHFPADIIWIDSDGFVTDIQTGVMPGEQYLVYNHFIARYVLMVNAGVVQTDHVNTGSYVFIPNMSL